ncbi:MAG: COX15/CtaA family protein [Acidobacteriota bacterium]
MSARGLHAFAVFMVLATLFLVFAGAMVTSTGSGLAVPDWPLSYGMLMPPMVGGIFSEHGHRMVAGTVATLTLFLAVALAILEPRRWVRRMGFAAVGLVTLQAVLGGLTVLHFLPPALSVSHACVAQAFLCVIVTLAVVTSRAWKDATPLSGTAALSPRPFAILTGAIYTQLIVGATMRHLGAGLAIPDFPLSMGRLVPPFEALRTAPVAIHFLHRLGAAVVAALATPCLLSVARRSRERHELRIPGVALGLAIPVQIALGALTIWSAKAPKPTSLHVCNGALVLASSMALTLLVARRAPRAASVRAPGALAPVTA